MFKSLTLRALVNERLNAAADDVFALFEKTIAEYEEELCRSKEENKRKQRLLDYLCPKITPVRSEGQSPSTSPCPGLNQEFAETPRIKEEPGGKNVKQEEEQLPVPVSEFTAACVKSEDPSLLQGQTAYQEETQTKDTTDPKLCLKTVGDAEYSSDTDNDDDWNLPLSCTATQMETDEDHDNQDNRPRAVQNSGLSIQNKSAPVSCATVKDGEMAETDKRTEEEKHQCSVCRKTFRRKGHLQTHRLVHTDEKSYSCSLCNKTFKHSPHLKVHMRTHTGERPYSCTVCDKTFRYTSTLKTHMRTHTGEKPYSCSLCVKKFSQFGHLQTHIRSHTGEAPYSCSQCYKTFAQKYNLQAHMKTHTSKRPYSCPLCENEFASVRGLSVHMKVHREQSQNTGVLGDQS